MKKYELTDETITVDGKTLHRIRALVSIDIHGVEEGNLGGFVEKIDNLSMSGNAWVYGNAKVYGDALVYGNALVSDNAKVCGDARVYDYALVCGDALVSDNAKVCGNARVYGDAWVCGDAKVCGDAWVCKTDDYIVFKNWWSSGRYFTWTRSNDMWSVGCFFGTGDELIKKAYKDSEKSGREYERIVNYVEEIKSIINNQ